MTRTIPGNKSEGRKERKVDRWAALWGVAQAMQRGKHTSEGEQNMEHSQKALAIYVILPYTISNKALANKIGSHTDGD